MNKPKLTTVFMLTAALSVAVIFSACSGGAEQTADGTAQSTAATSGTLRGDAAKNRLAGVLLSSSENSLTVDLVNMPEGGRPEGRDAARRTPPESMPEGEAPPERPDGRNGEKPDRLQKAAPETTGESREIVLTADTKIRAGRSDETLTAEDLTKGDTLIIELSEDGTTAVSIDVMGKTGGEQ